ncbi:MAG: ATP-binding cassette domain-containing protein, partial [Muribaculaceae bacterium]|nr:ATP-binding cassette domain-containing protein [Muribaculaceae bacterium]
TLSDGERQKVMVARALAQQSGLIVLDEPTAFLDVAGRSDIMRLLRRLADGGCTILLSSHDIAASFAVADRLLITDPARQRLFCGTVSEAVREGALDRAFAGSGLRFDPAKGDYSY